MRYNFERFNQARRRAGRKPKVTLTKEGNFLFNKASMERFPKENRYITFYFDSQQKVIALELMAEETPYRIRSTRNDSFGTTSALAFLHFNFISHRKSHAYEIKQDEKTGFWLLDLKKKVSKKALYARQKS